MQSTTKNLIKTRAPVIVTLRNSWSVCWVKGKDVVVLWWFPKLLPTHIACRQVGDVLSSVDCPKTAGSWQVTMISCSTFLYSWRKQTPKPVILRIKLGHQRSSVEAAWPQSIEVEPNSLNGIFLGMNLQVTVTFLVEKKTSFKKEQPSPINVPGHSGARNLERPCAYMCHHYTQPQLNPSLPPHTFWLALYLQIQTNNTTLWSDTHKSTFAII